MATYYVAEGGSATDQAKENATSGTYPGGCLSVAGHNAETFAADDVISFSDEGGEIRAEIVLPSSGTSGHPITYDVKSGDSPVINGADLVTTWTQVNFFTEPSMEAGIDFWNAKNSGVLAHSTTQKWDGSYSLSVDATGAANRGTISDEIAVTAGVQYTLTFYGYSTASESVRLQLTDQDSNFMSNTDLSLVADTWTRFTKTFTAGAGDTGIFVALQSLDAGMAAIFYVDGFQIELGAAATAWSEDVWRAALTTEPTQVIFDTTRGTLDGVASVSLVDSTGDWFWASNVLYIYSTSDPDTAYTTPGIQASVRECVDFNSKDYIVFDGIDCKYSVDTGIKFNQGENLTLQNVSSTYNYGKGISVAAGDNNTVSNCVAQYNCSTAIAGVGSEANNMNNLTITGCVASDTVESAAAADSAGIKLFGSVGSTISYNTVENNVGGGIRIDGSKRAAEGGTADTDFCQNVTITGNYLNGNTFAHIFNEYGRGIVAKYNYCTGLVTGGAGTVNIKSSDLGAAGSYPETMVILCNVVDGNSLAGVIVITEGCSVIGNSINDATNGVVIGADNCDCKNNITDDCTRDLTLNGAYAGLDCDYNCWGSGLGTPIRRNSSNITVATHCSSHGQDCNSIISDPLYTDAPSGDLTLGGGSLCINAGVDLGASYDDALLPASTWPDAVVTASQDLHGSGWDIGAYVYAEEGPTGSFAGNRIHRIIHLLKNG